MQHAIGIAGIHLIRINVFRQGNHAAEFPLITLFSIELGLCFLGRLSLAGDSQQILLNGDIQRFGINPWAEQINIDPLLGDAHIDGGE